MTAVADTFGREGLIHPSPQRMTAEPDWDQVYAEQAPRVLNFFRYRLGDTADVEDLTAHTFEKAWCARHRYRHDVAGFATWLLTIARHVAIDHLRARHRDKPAGWLATLSPRQRELIAMKYGAGMTNRAIARATGLSESNVGTILHRALESLPANFLLVEEARELKSGSATGSRTSSAAPGRAAADLRLLRG